jgi:hypothetical protein
MREFTDPTYSGPDCVCCKTKQQIIKIIELERDTWTRPASFNYRLALTQLIERIENPDGRLNSVILEEQQRG